MTRTRHTVADRCYFGTDSVPGLLLGVRLPNAHEGMTDRTHSHRSADEEKQGLAPGIHHTEFEQHANQMTTLPDANVPV